MAYEFPRTVQSDSDVASPTQFNQDMTLAADTINLLDAHNINAADFAANAAVSATAFGTCYYNTVASDPGFKVATNQFGYPDETASNVFTVNNEQLWQIVTGGSVTDIVTGVSHLRIDGHVQFIWHGWVGSSSDTEHDHISNRSNGSGSASRISIPSNIQFALRVDGVVLDSTITGHVKTTRRDFVPLKAHPERNITALSMGALLSQPGPQQPRTQRIAGIGPQCYGAQMQTVIQVDPGLHTVELVVRRLTASDATQRVAENLDDVITLYNRVLFVEEIPFLPPVSYSAVGVSLPAIDPETIAGTASLFAQRMEVLETAINELTAANIRPYSLRNEHLPAILLGTALFKTLNSVPVTGTNNWFDGESGAIAVNQNNDTGWTLLHNGSGTNYTTPGGFTVVGVDSVIRIHAHVHLKNIADAANTFTLATGHFAAIALGYRANGTWNIIQHSITYVNSWNTILGPAGYTSEETLVSLLAFIDYRLFPATYNIQNIGLFGAAFMNANYAGTTPWARSAIEWRQAAITAVQFRN